MVESFDDYLKRMQKLRKDSIAEYRLKIWVCEGGEKWIGTGCILDPKPTTRTIECLEE